MYELTLVWKEGSNAKLQIEKPINIKLLKNDTILTVKALFGKRKENVTIFFRNMTAIVQRKMRRKKK
jgi:hypothetical protein